MTMTMTIVSNDEDDKDDDDHDETLGAPQSLGSKYYQEEDGWLKMAMP